MATAFGMLNATFGLYAKSFHITVKQTGVLFSISAVASIIGAPIIGRLAEKYDPRKVCIGAFYISSISICGTFFSNNVEGLLFWRFLGGVHAACIPTLLVTMSNAFPLKARSSAASWLQGLIPVGFVIGPLFSSAVTHHSAEYGLTIAVATAGVISVVSSLTFMMSIYDLPYLKGSSHAASKPNIHPLPDSSGPAWRRLMLPMAILATSLFIYSGLFSILYQWALLSREANIAFIGTFYALFSVSNALAQLAVFPLVERKITNKTMAMMSIVIVLIGAGVQLVSVCAASIAVSTLLIGFGAGLSSSSCTGWLLTAFKEGAKTRSFGNLGLLNGLVKFVSPMVLSYILSTFSLHVLFLVISWLLLVIVSTAAVALWRDR